MGHKLYIEWGDASLRLTLAVDPKVVEPLRHHLSGVPYC